jgi:hypothetical protein
VQEFTAHGATEARVIFGRDGVGRRKFRNEEDEGGKEGFSKGHSVVGVL